MYYIQRAIHHTSIRAQKLTDKNLLCYVTFKCLRYVSNESMIHRYPGMPTQNTPIVNYGNQLMIATC